MSRDDSRSHGTDEGFLDRWSRLKKAGGDPSPEDDPEPRPFQSAERESVAAEGASSIENPDEPLPDLPPIESLNEESDYSVFLSSRVPEEIRGQALRKLFHLPQFNATDGLDDYAESFRKFSGLGSILTHEMRRALERELAGLATDEPSSKNVSRGQGESSTRESEADTPEFEESKSRLSRQASSSLGGDAEEPTEDV